MGERGLLGVIKLGFDHVGMDLLGVVKIGVSMGGERSGWLVGRWVGVWVWGVIVWRGLEEFEFGGRKEGRWKEMRFGGDHCMVHGCVGFGIASSSQCFHPMRNIFNIFSSIFYLTIGLQLGLG